VTSIKEIYFKILLFQIQFLVLNTKFIKGCMATLTSYCVIIYLSNIVTLILTMGLGFVLGLVACKYAYLFISR